MKLSPKCEECILWDDNVVQGYGSPKPSLILVGEAPGKQEAQTGKPFVGRAGKILRNILNHLGIPDDALYITNTVKCRPPGNRNPTAGEIACCRPHLEEEIAGIVEQCDTPPVIVALGAVPGKAIFGTLSKIRTDRGVVKESNLLGLHGLITYHPAATLYAKGDSLLPFIINDMGKAWRTQKGIEPQRDPTTQTVIIDNDEIMLEVLERLHNMEPSPLSFDWETTGLDVRKDGGFCLGLSWKEGTGIAIPVAMVEKYSQQLAKAMEKHLLIGFNAALFDSRWNKKYGLPYNVRYDPMHMHYLLDERPQPRNLEALTVMRLDAPPYESQMLAKYKTNKANMIKDIPAEVVYEYCAKDVDWTLRLWKSLLIELQEEEDLISLYNALFLPATLAFADIRERGVWVDEERLLRLKEEYTQKKENSLQFLREETGKPKFNPNSHPQVQKQLWDIRKLEEPMLYGRKPRSANAETLEALLDQYDDPFVKALAEYRKVYTLLSRYLEGLPPYIEDDGRIRCNFHFDRTETGRLSTTDPALHTIPRDSGIRGLIAAPPGHVLIQADYAQVEIRMVAYIAQDEELTRLLRSGVDFHTMMASQAFQVPVDEVKPEQRQAAKAVSFGLLYLMGDKKLAAGTGLPPREATRFVKRYKALMPGVQRWIAKIKKAVVKDQVIVSPFGRQRRFPLVTEDNLHGLQREAVNFPVQSGASDLTLTSVVRLHELFKEKYPDVHITLMTHDSLIAECPEEIAEEVAVIIKNVMEDVPFTTTVPFPADVKIGKRFGEGKEIAV